MHPDLERVIQLQQIEDAAERARRTIANEPVRQQELAAALEAARHVQAEIAVSLDAQRRAIDAEQEKLHEIERARR